MSQQPPLQQNKQYLNFINSLHCEATKISYRRALQYYMKFIKTNSISTLIRTDTKTIEDQIITYLVYMREQKLSYPTKNQRLSALRKFYDMNDVLLNWRKISQYLGENTRPFKDRAYTTQEVQQILTKCDERMRVVVLLLASTGMRIGAVSDLKLKHLTKIEQCGLYQIVVYEGFREEYYCFCSSECASAIDSYLAYRERCYEKLSPHSPLIREQFARNNPDSARKPRPIPLDTLSHILRDLLIASGIHNVEHLTETRTNGRIKKDIMCSHGFRKMVTTAMIKSKLNHEDREILLGHSIQLGNSYYRPQADELLNQYLKVVDLLTIDDSNRLRLQLQETTVQHSEEWTLLKQEIMQMKNKFLKS